MMKARKRHELHSRFLALTRLPARNISQEKTIHRLRVLGKTLRAYLQLFEPVLGKKTSRAWSSKLSRAAHPLAEERTAQVFHKLLPKIDLPAAAKKAPAASESSSRSPHLAMASLLKKTRILLRDQALPRLTPKEIHHQLKKSEKKMRQSKEMAGDSRSDSSLHRWRKAVKRLLYQMELLFPSPGGKQRKTLKQLHQLEDRLGKIHDWNELESFLKKSPHRQNSKLFRRLRHQRKKETRTLFA